MGSFLPSTGNNDRVFDQLSVARAIGTLAMDLIVITLNVGIVSHEQ